MTEQSHSNEKENRYLLSFILIPLVLILELVYFWPVYNFYSKQKQLRDAAVEMKNIAVLVDASLKSTENKPIILNIRNWQRFSLIEQVELLQTTDQILLTGVVGKGARGGVNGCPICFFSENPE